MFKEDLPQIMQFTLAAGVEGIEGFAKRPHGTGNLVMGVEVLHKGEDIHPHLVAKIKETHEQGGATGLIVISEDPQPRLQEELGKYCTQFLLIDNIPDDPMGLTFSQLLKWICNLISNGTMVKVNKVFGNSMIDVRTSNHKLIDRCMRIILKYWTQRHPTNQLDDETLYNLVIKTCEKQLLYEAHNPPKYTPSTVKVVITLLEKKCSFEKAHEILREINEDISKL